MLAQNFNDQPQEEEDQKQGNANNMLLKVKVQDLEEAQMNHLIEQLNKAQEQFQIANVMVSFLKGCSEITADQINQFSSILRRSESIKSLQIRNRHSNGIHSNVAALLENFRGSAIKELKLQLKDLQNINECVQIRQLLPDLQYLKTLSLIFTSEVRNQDFADFFPTLGLCTSLSNLTISIQDEAFYGQSLRSMIEDVCQIKQLQSLNIELQGNKLYNKDVALFNMIPSNLNELKTLSISLKYNNLIEEVEGQLLQIEPIQRNNILESLIFREQIENIHETCNIGLNLISSYLNITSLNFDLSQYGSDLLIKSIQQIAKCYNLNSLTITVSNKTITQNVVPQFQEALSSLVNLKQLIINVQMKEPNNLYSIPQLIYNCNQIKKLRIEFDSFIISNDQLNILFSTLPSMASLQNLEFGFNKQFINSFEYKNFNLMMKGCKQLHHVYLDFGFKRNRSKIQKKFSIPLKDSSTTNPVLTKRLEQASSKFSLMSAVLLAKKTALSAVYFKRLSLDFQKLLVFKKTPRLVQIDFI